MLQETIELLRLSLRQLCEIALAVIAMGAFGVFLLRRVVPWLRSWNARMSILLASCAIAAYYGGGKNDGGEQSPDAPSNMLMAPFGAVMDAVPSGAMDAPGIRSITKDSYGVEMEFHRPGSGATQALSVAVCATTNLTNPECWFDMTYLSFAPGVTNVMCSLSYSFLEYRGISDLGCFTFIESGDSDGDGIENWRERLVTHTDPCNVDTDADGLPDGDEINLWHTNPNEPHSFDGVHADGMAVRLDGLDPFSCPGGSTNTVWEHLFYSGTTNGTFSFPASSHSMAVIGVSASGIGSGEFIIGDKVVPLLGCEARDGDEVRMPTLKTAVVKCRDIPLRFQGDDTLRISVDSDDFAYGSIPTEANTSGFIHFPDTGVTPACFHDLNLRKVTVSLPAENDSVEMGCTWSGGMDVGVEDLPPRAAELTAFFPANSSRTITYTLYHPMYVFGRTEYEQTARFCPRPPDPPGPGEDPQWYGGGEVGSIDLEGYVDDAHWCCYWGQCAPYCGCGCGGSCRDDLYGDDEQEQDDGDECPVHCVPYDDCAHLHESDYNLAKMTTPHLQNVLKIRNPAERTMLHLDVPTNHVYCCPCPDHQTNFVEVAFKSHLLRLVGQNGMAFLKSYESCDVFVDGVAPSSSLGDASLVFGRLGEVYLQHDYTVLGVGIESSPAFPSMSFYNSRSRSLGFPFTVATNAWNGAILKLLTRVKLPSGNVRLELKNATAPFTVWYYDGSVGEFVRLLDGAVGPRVVDMSLPRWRRRMGGAYDEDDGSTSIRVTSSAAGHVDLSFKYWAVIDGKFVEDGVEQRVTAVEPPLLPDYNRDGAVDSQDVTEYLDGRILHFWSNSDVWRGDDAFSSVYDDCSRGIAVSNNGADAQVNGRNDLVNLLPLALKIRPFIDAWGASAQVVLRPSCNVGETIRRCYSDVAHAEAGSLLRADTVVAGGGSVPLHNAPLAEIPAAGEDVALAPVGGDDSGFVLLEFVGHQFSTRPVSIVIKVDGREVYSFCPEINVSDVDYMYRWRNIRWAAGGDIGQDYVGNNTQSPYGRPDDQCDGTHVVFVHGYNVNEREARMWGRAVFKRLWWAGMDSSFTVVAWRGDDSQTWIPVFQTLATPNYQVNVEHAFATASTFADLVNSLPGRKYILAHSLGNMLVSAAAQDHGLEYSRYFLLNAAVPVEAYGSSSAPADAEARRRMTPEAWQDYPERVRAAGWHELFDSSDPRSGLTWKGRFASVSNTVNYYSSEDEVLKCGNGEWHYELQREWAWYNQERYKGVKSLVSEVAQFGRNEGGWAFNSAYDIPPIVLPSVPGSSGNDQILSEARHMEASDTIQISDDHLKTVPFFGPFADNAICSSNAIAEIAAPYRAQLLADAVPAESLPAGFTQVPAWNCNQYENRDLTSNNYRNSTMMRVLQDCSWVHSFFISVPYSVVYGLYEDISRRVKQQTPGGDNE